MKIYINSLLILSLVFTSQILFAQKAPVKKKVMTEQFTVHGVCGGCEKRIEKAALKAGAIAADWNKETKILEVTYKTKKVRIDDLKKAVAGVGHDTDSCTATDQAYGNLPECCRYRDGVETH